MPIAKLEAGLPVLCERGAVALHEVFVCVRRMELDERNSAVVTSCQMLGEILGDIGLASSRWALENYLLLLLQQTFDVFEVSYIDIQFSCERFKCIFCRRWRFRAIEWRRLELTIPFNPDVIVIEVEIPTIFFFYSFANMKYYLVNIIG